MTVRILFFGYGEMGCTGLEFFLDRGEDIAAVVTHEDDPAERRWFRSLAERAVAAGLPVHFGERLGRRGLRDLATRVQPDFIFSFYYRRLLPPEVLRRARRGALNLHGSLLPRLRGRAPLNWALVEGEPRTGVTLHYMIREPDAGDIVAQRGWDIGPRDTAKTLFDRAVVETRRMLEEVWPLLKAGTAPRLPQDPRRATYRGRRTPEDGRIDWTLPTARIDGLVRAVTEPFPGAFTFLAGRKLMVWEGRPAAGRGAPGTVLEPFVVATGDGAYRIDRCTFADDPSAAPLLNPGLKLGDLS
ncbi:MAG TPA: formyltransferase family protein [Planctomycetota bacterium]|jgi:methionyl-tRNA formyltransferase|nr:formyltransferase family protein [Planctomycetota bacterium]